jgi:hypothetical protein
MLTLALGLVAVMTSNSRELVAADVVRPVPQVESLSPEFWAPPSAAYRVLVRSDGLHALSYSTLQAAGLPVDSIDPRTFQMYFMGREMAISVTGENDGGFNPGDTVLFYGRSVDSMYFEGLLPDHKYTATAVFWLGYGGAAGKRMVIKDGGMSGSPSGPYAYREHQEQQKRYTSNYPRYSAEPRFLAEDDRWQWIRLQVLGAAGSKSQDFTFVADNLATGQLSGVFAAHVVGGSQGTHGLRVYVNGTLVYDNGTTWKDYEPFEAVGSFAQSLLVNGNNTIRLEVYNTGQSFTEEYIDWLEVGYNRVHVAQGNGLIFDGQPAAGAWRYTVENFASNDVQVYDISDLYNVGEVSNISLSGVAPFAASFGSNDQGRRYMALTAAARIAVAAADIQLAVNSASSYTPANLLDTANGADWIMITHRDFWSSALPLAVHRSKQYRVAMIDVQAIYDQFNGGMPSAESVRSFLAYAYANWQAPKPQFVLLAGGGTNDMRRYGGDNTKLTYVPTFLYPADPTLGDTSADNRFVMLEGNDAVPDMHLGRFPTYSAAEISIMVGKTIHYEDNTLRRDSWTRNVMFVSDDLEGGGGNFYAFSDEIADGYHDQAQTIKYLPQPFRAQKVYLGQTCDLGNPALAVECRATISNTLNVDGALFVSYVGHAQKKNWAVEKLLDSSLASAATNYDRLSIFLPMACFEGFFFEAPLSERSLSETYLLNPNGGAVASWSPTGFGVATGHDYLEKGMFLATFTDQVNTLGEATTAGKAFLHDNAPPGAFADLLDTFTLLGDPALQMQLFEVPTATEMVGMSATLQQDGVSISWQSNSEVAIVGYNVIRRDQLTGDSVKVNDHLIPAQFSGSTSGGSYQFLDSTAVNGGSYNYSLELVGSDGVVIPYGSADVQGVALTFKVFLPVMTRQ